MTVQALLFQAANGLAAASELFLIAAGLSLIFGVSRIINIAHGSRFMLGSYLAVTLTALANGAVTFWAGILAAATLVALIGAVIEMLLLRRIYRAPELFQLLATFSLVLIISDLTLLIWGPEDLLAPRVPGLEGRHLPVYDLLLIATGPLVLGLLYVLLARTRLGRLVRAATEDREMVGALGINQAALFTAVFALGSFLAGLGGALSVAREPANLNTDLNVISDAFVVVVVGGMGSIWGAYLAAVLIAEVKALCIGLGTMNLAGFALNFSKMTLVAEFLVMAVVLIARPYGLLGSVQSVGRGASTEENPLRAPSPALRLLGVGVLLALALLPLLARSSPYAVVLGIDVLIAVLFATTLHFILGPGGMPSFGHAAYFGLGAYAAALLVKWFGISMPVSLLLAPVLGGAGAVVFGYFAVRLSGVYLAMLTLAFAQIVWSVVFQWTEVTGGSNGILGIWPTAPFASRDRFFWLTAALTVVGVMLLRRILLAPFGYAMRAGRARRCAPRRSASTSGGCTGWRL